ncbi:MAG TPA: DUF2089 family protein [Bacteroidales bacterium]|nr:DUF2089 family protein [Bacteroidales bacterium]
MDKKLPVLCPGCESGLKVNSLYCDSCQTTITGLFELPLLLKLDKKEQDFILDFIKCSGSLKIMAEKLKLSYPTVRNMLDDLINKIQNLQNNKQ